ncbi:hypothetical protein B566_EDAN012117 [Ephemera danica]|nr:hypothetical protein B566_EDAN012117 [Ephemera danica]
MAADNTALTVLSLSVLIFLFIRFCLGADDHIMDLEMLPREEISSYHAFDAPYEYTDLLCGVHRPATKSAWVHGTFLTGLLFLIAVVAFAAESFISSSSSGSSAVGAGGGFRSASVSSAKSSYDGPPPRPDRPASASSRGKIAMRILLRFTRTLCPVACCCWLYVTRVCSLSMGPALVVMLHKHRTLQTSASFILRASEK